MSDLYLKCLRPGRIAPLSYVGWAEPGVWMPVRLCESGYHVLADTRQLLGFSLNYDVWICEVDGEGLHEPSKSVFPRARLVEQLPWDDRARRLFAVDCAEDVLPIFERDRPGDDRPRQAIEVARRFAHGEATWQELDAAEAVAEAAAQEAAEAAHRAAAQAAAEDATRAAAWAAAARAAARDAQAVRLAAYLGIEPPGWEAG